MNRSFLATFTVAIAFLSGCAASKHALQPTLPLKNPFASDDAVKAAASAESVPVTPSSAPAVATPVLPPAAPPTIIETVVPTVVGMVYLPDVPSGLASLFGPLVGCERGVYSLRSSTPARGSFRYFWTVYLSLRRDPSVPFLISLRGSGSSPASRAWESIGWK